MSNGAWYPLVHYIGRDKIAALTKKYTDMGLSEEVIDTILIDMAKACALTERSASQHGYNKAQTDAINYLFERLGIDPEMAWQAIQFAMEEAADG